MLDAPDHAVMIDRITNSKFNTTRLKPGYDEEEVDNFLDQVVAQLRAGGLPEVRGARFSATLMRPGYVQQDVDDLLREIDLYAEPRRSALGRRGQRAYSPKCRHDHRVQRRSPAIISSSRRTSPGLKSGRQLRPSRSRPTS
jgi:DivIVA domain-containing protein